MNPAVPSPSPPPRFSRQAPGEPRARLGPCRQGGRLGRRGAGFTSSYLLLGFTAGLVDRVLVLFGGLARILLLLVVFGRLRGCGKRDGTVSGGEGGHPLPPPPGPGLSAGPAGRPPSGTLGGSPRTPSAPAPSRAHHAAAAAAAPPRCRPRKEAPGARRGETPWSRAASGARRDAASGAGRAAPWRSSASMW